VGLNINLQKAVKGSNSLHTLSIYSYLFLSLEFIFSLSPFLTQTFYPIYLKMIPERITDIRKAQPKNYQNPISHFRGNRLEGQTDRQTNRQTDKLMTVDPPPLPVGVGRGYKNI
jgi:hypothetical protein